MKKIKIVRLFFNCKENFDLPDFVVTRKSILFFLKIIFSNLIQIYLKLFVHKPQSKQNL